jgi:hypothetical protein
MTRVLVAGVAALALLVGVACDDDSPTSPSETITLSAQLSPANEVPPVSNAEASGSGTATIRLHVTRDSAGTITAASADFQVTLAGFPPATALTMAHIHQGAVGTNGSIVVDTGLTPGQTTLATGAGSFTKNGIDVTPTVAQAIVADPSAFYFNIHTVLNSDGAARGQLTRS